MQRGPPGPEDHHSRAVRRAQTVGAPGSEEHPPHRQRGGRDLHYFTVCVLGCSYSAVGQTLCLCSQLTNYQLFK